MTDPTDGPGSWDQPNEPTQQPGHPAGQPPQPKSRKQKLLMYIGIPVAVLIVLSAIFGQDDEDEDDDSAAAGGADTSTVEHSSRSSTTTTTTTSKAPTSTTPPVKPQEVSGTGDDVVDLDETEAAQTMEFDCSSCGGNVVVKSDGAESILVNEIDGYHGTRPINLQDHSTTSQLTVEAEGPWTINLRPLTDLEPQTDEVSGTGDDVVLLDGEQSRATITNEGESNFVVRNVGVDSGAIDIVVNEIGGYSGTRPVELPGLFVVESSGDWTITAGPD